MGFSRVHPRSQTVARRHTGQAQGPPCGQGELVRDLGRQLQRDSRVFAVHAALDVPFTGAQLSPDPPTSLQPPLRARFTPWSDRAVQSAAGGQTLWGSGAQRERQQPHAGKGGRQRRSCGCRRRRRKPTRARRVSLYRRRGGGGGARSVPGRCACSQMRAPRQSAGRVVVVSAARSRGHLTTSLRDRRAR